MIVASDVARQILHQLLARLEAEVGECVKRMQATSHDAAPTPKTREATPQRPDGQASMAASLPTKSIRIRACAGLS